MIKDNLNQIEEKIQKACDRVGRSRDEVTLIAVSKTKPIETVDEAYRCGIREFGENKVQELQEKHPALEKDIHWHMIGHLQRNKVKYIADYIHCIHSVDSLRLLEQIEKEAKKNNRVIDVLLEVNVAHEDSKFGLTAKEAVDLAQKLDNFSNVCLKGLMTVAPFVDNSEENRVYFRELKQLFVDIQDKNIDNVNMSVLSMGMSNDFEIAIEEGATMVRVGTEIFGRRNYL